MKTEFQNKYSINFLVIVRSQIPQWEFSHIALPVKNLFELRTHYADLLRNDHYSVPDLNVQCQRILDSRHAPMCQQYLKKGCTPAPYRGALWASVLDSKLHDYVSNKYYQSCLPISVKSSSVFRFADF